MKDIVKMLLPNSEQEKINSKCLYDDEIRSQKVPLFIIKNKTARFPKLPHNQLKQMIKNSKAGRELVFVDEEIIEHRKKSHQ